MKKEIIREHYSNGQLWNETPYKNGQWHGLKRGWHFFNVLQYETPYKNSVRCGARVVFYY